MLNTDKTTLVMWCKNGALFLPSVLPTLNKVIPSEVVKDKIIVDDGSVDDTVQIAERLGWTVIPNCGKGISDGANTALKNVETDFFCSFEQDLVLNKDWYAKCVSTLKKGATVVSGIRYDINKSIRCIDEFSFDRYQILGKTAGVDGYLYGRTIDNTMYVTDTIRELGGFPKLEGGAGVDTLLSLKIAAAKLTWAVNYSVVSDHLRKSLYDTLRHYVWYGRNYPELERYIGHSHVNVYRQIYRFAASPARGLDIALRKKRWQVMLVYPAVRFCILAGIFQGLKGDYK